MSPYERDFNTQTLVVIGTDCIDSCESNYHTIITTTTPCIDSLNDNLVFKFTGMIPVRK